MTIVEVKQSINLIENSLGELDCKELNDLYERIDSLRKKINEVASCKSCDWAEDGFGVTTAVTRRPIY